MATKHRIVKYLLVLVIGIVLYFILFGFIDNGLKNQTLSGVQLPAGWSTQQNSVGLCIGYMPEHSGFPFATERNAMKVGCGKETSPLASLLNFLILLAIGISISYGIVKLVSSIVPRKSNV